MKHIWIAPANVVLNHPIMSKDSHLLPQNTSHRRHQSSSPSSSSARRISRTRASARNTSHTCQLFRPPAATSSTLALQLLLLSRDVRMWCRLTRSLWQGSGRDHLQAHPFPCPLAASYSFFLVSRKCSPDARPLPSHVKRPPRSRARHHGDCLVAGRRGAGGGARLRVVARCLGQ
jgi:hypothetical protein